MESVDLRIGHIVRAWKHPQADTLFVEEVDLGEVVPRTVVSGLVGRIALDELVGMRALFVCNLKPVSLRGVESQAMLLAAGPGIPVRGPSQAAAGALVQAHGLRRQPTARLSVRAWARVQEHLRTDENGVATWAGRPLLVLADGRPGPDVGPAAFCTAPGAPNAPIT